MDCPTVVSSFVTTKGHAGVGEQQIGQPNDDWNWGWVVAQTRTGRIRVNHDLVSYILPAWVTM